MKSGKKAGKGTVEKPTSGREGKNIIAALDIGSSKICCFIAEVGHHGSIDVVGIGHQASRGVKSGTIIDLKAAETAIALAVESAEMMAKSTLQGQPIKSVFVNVPGTHTLSNQITASVRIAGEEVTEREIRHAKLQARGLVVPGKDEILHVITGPYSIDKQSGIQEPRGMSGHTLGAKLHVVSALSNATRNIRHATAQNHLEIDGFCASPYAAGLATLVDDEKDLGCTVIDMGGGTTNIAVFAEGRMIHSSAIPVGGQHVTSDIARGLTTSIADAERIKTLYGSAHATSLDDGALIDVPPLGEEEHAQANYVPKSLLTGVIQPRIEETFELVRARLTDSGIGPRTGRRVVLTGGASQLPGLTDIAQLILDKQIRLGHPQRIKGLAEATNGPAFSTAAGLLLYAAEHADEMPHLETAGTFHIPFSGEWMQKVTHWLKENW